jgi:hypothetical protein
MEHREELKIEEWFLFLVPEQSRESEWKRLKDNFNTAEEREAVLLAFLDTKTDNILTPILAELIEDSYLDFVGAPSYSKAMEVAGQHPRQHEEQGRFPF